MNEGFADSGEAVFIFCRLKHQKGRDWLVFWFKV